MLPLLGFSLLAVALILERGFFWLRVLKRQESIVQQALALYKQNPQAVLPLLVQNADLPMARIFLTALELDCPSPEDFRLALESSSQAELPVMRRFNTVFDTIIAVSPLLGLLGTVLGLIQSFSALRVGDVGGSDSVGVTAGISEALISTAAGLIVAIFTLLFANLFRSFYQTQRALIQKYGGKLELLYRSQDQSL
ncbi:MAG: MotA/TolQ/ExbB proton channel family protein [Microcoleus vaginatus WJT46-NPBG5]|nr:MotA/TolQ/ExbB proton channel family protein [Microcoleus vaginatus WJT46-NPBG5]